MNCLFIKDNFQYILFEKDGFIWYNHKILDWRKRYVNW